MGILPKLGKGSNFVKAVVDNNNDVLSGNDITVAAGANVPDTELMEIPLKPIPVSDAQQRDQLSEPEKGSDKDSSEHETPIVKQEPKSDDVAPKSDHSVEHAKQHDKRTYSASDTEPSDHDTIIVKQESKCGESSGPDPQHTFHVLQEQILNLQCKVEMHKVKKENLVNLGTIIFSDTDDNDLANKTPTSDPDSCAPKLDTLKPELVSEPEENENINKPKTKRKRNVIESSTDSDEDDNIPRAELRRKLLPLLAKTIKQPKKRRKNQQFTTKPPPAQTSKPVVNRGKMPTANDNDDDTSLLDGDTSGGETNKNDSGYNSTSSKQDKTAVSTENASEIETSTSTSTAVTTGSDKKRKRNFYCIKCDVVKPSLRELNDHFRNTHDWVHCHNCGKPFPMPSALSKHMYTHGANLLKCDQCSKQFPFESQLISRKISHDEEGQFPCDQCPKRMKNKSDLKKHLSAHTDEIYECQYCDEYVASDIRNLKEHLKTHDKLLRYVCRYCAEPFKRYNQRRRHQMKPNSCPKMPKQVK